ncbi:galactose-1-epimerase [Dongshaea marina]|uniref:galactose-1-epimerase n=1 Tax=Dongshaea marina TaxID=2047966 RepID=UPI000D3E1B1A|nr:galactose-1-epimerase [Dongshaea marina]
MNQSREQVWHSDSFEQPIHHFELNNGQGLKMRAMELGATITSVTLEVQGETRELVLGCDTLEDYLSQEVYLGATVGRYANRIANARINDGEQEFELSINQAPHCLHGGVDGFHRRHWQGEQLDAACVRFKLSSADGDQGFPGTLDVNVTYRLTEDNRLSIEYRATTDKRTPVNLTNHSYFNLNGYPGDCRRHTVQLQANRYLPINQQGIPLSTPISVEGSMELRSPVQLSQQWLQHPQLKLARGYDHCYLLDREAHQGKPAAIVSSDDERVTLYFYTDQPAVQFYTGNYLYPAPARAGTHYQNHQGFCLEAQRAPDGPAHPEYSGDVWLNPGDTYRQTTQYQFLVR